MKCKCINIDLKRNMKRKLKSMYEKVRTKDEGGENELHLFNFCKCTEKGYSFGIGVHRESVFYAKDMDFPLCLLCFARVNPYHSNELHRLLVELDICMDIANTIYAYMNLFNPFDPFYKKE